MFATLSDSPHVLVVDDEPDVAWLIASSLKHAGFAVSTASDGFLALSMVRSERPALVVLDLMLPGIHGNEVCKLLKGEPSTAQIPIVMVTAQINELDRVLGFELGADDYITKPFSPRELVLRVQAVLKRRGVPLSPVNASRAAVAQREGIVLDHDCREVRINGEDVPVTAIEFRLLAFLMENAGKVQNRDALLKQVWDYESPVDTRTIDTHVRRLREKLGGASNCIATFRGAGYCFFDRA